MKSVFPMSKTQTIFDVFNFSGSGWVGWKRKEEKVDSEFVEIIFAFDKVRQFSSLQLYVNNFPSKGVQVKFQFLI